VKTVLQLFSNPHFIQFKFSYFLLLLMTISASFLEVFSLGVIIPFVKTFLGMEILADENSTSIFKSTLTYAIKFFGGDFKGVLLLFGIANLGRIAISFVRDFWKLHLSTKIRTHFMVKFFDKYVDADFGHYLKTKQGDINYAITSFPLEIANFFNVLPKIVIDATNFIMLSSFLAFLSWKVFIIIFLGGGIVSGFILYQNGKRLKVVGKQCVQSNERCVGLAQEMINGIKEIKINNLQGEWKGKFERESNTFYKSKLSSGVLASVPSTVIEVIFFVSLIIVAYSYVVKDIDSFKQALPLGIVFVFAIFRMLPSLNSLLAELSRAYNFEFVLEKFNSLVDQRTQNIKWGHDVSCLLENSIKLQGVYFSYSPDQLNFTLRDLSFEIVRGKTIALVGHSGSGKSSLVNLLVGLFQTPQGEISVDGMNLRDCNIEHIRTQIGYVPQDPFLFRGSILQNVILDKPFDKELYDKVMGVSGCQDFVAVLHSKDATEVGDKGMSLSGGQRQRLCLARALYKKPKLLILDEATSALDSITERKITTALKVYTSDICVLVLAHRLDTIKDADQINVLVEGEIVESGTFETLMSLRGEFFKLYETKEGLS
jgi:ABC-type multidrug transport system fused ATPase/permease subunit